MCADVCAAEKRQRCERGASLHGRSGHLGGRPCRKSESLPATALMAESEGVPASAPGEACLLTTSTSLCGPGSTPRAIKIARVWCSFDECAPVNGPIGRTGRVVPLRAGPLAGIAPLAQDRACVRGLRTVPLSAKLTEVVTTPHGYSVWLELVRAQVSHGTRSLPGVWRRGVVLAP